MEERLVHRRHALGSNHPNTLSLANNLAHISPKTRPVRGGSSPRRGHVRRAGVTSSALTIPVLCPQQTTSSSTWQQWAPTPAPAAWPKTRSPAAAACSATATRTPCPPQTTSLGCSARWGKPRRHVASHEDTLARRRDVLGADHPSTLSSANNLVVDLAAVGAYARARRLAEDTLARRRRVLGDSHPDTLSSANNLAHVLRLQGEYEEARRLDEDTLRRREEVLGEDHPDTLSSANNLIIDLLELGDSERARRLEERMGRSERGRSVRGEEDPRGSLVPLAEPQAAHAAPPPPARWYACGSTLQRDRGGLPRRPGEDPAATSCRSMPDRIDVDGERQG